MTVITNTTLISNFCSVGKLELVRAVWGEVYLPEHVYTEIQEGKLQGYRFYDNIELSVFPFSPDGWLKLTSLSSQNEFELFGSLLGNLHHGEAACLAICKYRNWVFLSDDKITRQAARRLQIDCSGTLGILLSLVRQKVVSLEQADSILSQMCERGYYSPVDSLSELFG